MQFNSIEFLIFLPIVFLLYWSMHKSIKAQNILIVAVSYIFYGWWNVKFLFLIALTSFLSYFSGVLIARTRFIANNSDERLTPKMLMLGNVIINLHILGVFKYYNFFIDNLVDLFAVFGIHLHITSLYLILPVGISFYTFQALSYTIDVYKGRICATHDIVAFFAYVSFFPQLVAGPIERATNLLPQFLIRRTFCYDKAVDGMRQILWGFFMKIVIADNCAGIVNVIFEHYDKAHWVMLVMGAIMFAFQIYGDFAGYSNIAIGCARLFGFELLENFRTPYFSHNIPEFWRRWHISLNTWFRDYVYIPLGGNRRGRLRQTINTFIVFALSGLWHGANWTYVAWGLWHGVFASLYKKGRDSSNKGFMIGVTFVLVTIGWILFRSDSVVQAIEYLGGICSLQNGWGISEFGFSYIQTFVTLGFIIILLLCEYMTQEKAFPLSLMPCNRILRWGLYLFIVMLLFLFPGKSETFIYFQF